MFFILAKMPRKRKATSKCPTAAKKSCTIFSLDKSWEPQRHVVANSVRDIVSSSPMPRVLGQDISFQIPATRNSVSLSETRGILRCRIVRIRDEKTELCSDDDNVTQTNLLPLTIFSNLKIIVQDHSISNFDPTLAYESLIHALTQLSDAERSTILAGSGFQPYEPDLSSVVDGKEKISLALHQRWLKSRGSEVMEFVFPIFDAVFLCRRLLPSATNLGLVFQTSKPSQVLVSPDLSPNYSIEILDFKLLVKEYELSQYSLIAEQKALGSSGGMQLPILKRSATIYAIPAGTKTLSKLVQQPTDGSNAVALLVCLLDEEAYFGSYKKDSYEMHNHGLSVLSFEKGGVFYTPYTPQYREISRVTGKVVAEASYMKDFLNLLDQLSAIGKNIYINEANWPYNNIYCFSLSKDGEFGSEPPNIPLEESLGVVHATFSNPTDRPLLLYVQQIYPSRLCFSKQGEAVWRKPT